jgi:PKD repeat protein
VTLTCPFHLIVSAFPGFGQLLPNPATLSATAYFPVRTGTIAVAAPTCTGTAPTATIAASPTSGSAPLSVTFALGSSGSPTGWTLDYGDGSADGSWKSGSGAPPATLTHTYASADQPTFDSTSGNVTGFTPYVATLTTWNNCGYSAPATTQVTVNGISTWFTITWQQGTTTCTPGPCTLTAGTLLNFQGFAYQTGDGQNGTPASPCSWSWVFGGSTGSNNTSTLQSPSYTYATSGTYTPTLSVTCAGSTATSSQTIAVAGCVVPSLVGNSVATADINWAAAGFLTTPQVVGNTNQGAYTWVTSQNVASGTTDPLCSTNIHLTVGPTPTPTP